MDDLDLIRPDMFTGIRSTIYLQWLEIQRRRFEEIRRGA